MCFNLTDHCVFEFDSMFLFVCVMEHVYVLLSEHPGDRGARVVCVCVKWASHLFCFQLFSFGCTKIVNLGQIYLKREKTTMN